MPETIASLLPSNQAMLLKRHDSVAFMGNHDNEKSDAERLEARLAGFDRGQRVAFAKDHRIPGGASAMYQHAKGIRPISIDAAIAYAKAFGCGIEEISPTVAMKAMEVAALVSDGGRNTLKEQSAPPYQRWPFEHVSEREYYDLTPEGQIWVQAKTHASIAEARERFGVTRSKMKA